MPRVGGMATPQPLRDIDPLARASFESELWDDFSNVIFQDSRTPSTTYIAPDTETGSPSGTNLCYLEIPCQVQARLEIIAWSLWSTAAGTVNMEFGPIALTATLPMPGLSIANAAVIETFGAGNVFQMYFSTALDVPSGITELALAMGVAAGSPDITLLSNTLTVRRGRKP